MGRRTQKFNEIEKSGTGSSTLDRQEQTRMGTHNPTTPPHAIEARPALTAGEQERLIRQLLGEVETLYERNTNPLLLTRPHRRRWGFVRALGATRLSHVLGAPRDAVVAARRLAFYRWRYWFFRYEAALWNDIARRGAQEWERNLLRYLDVRAALRQGTLSTLGSVFLAWALRSLSTVTWRTHDSSWTWRSVWMACSRGARSHAYAIAEHLCWSDRQWRRAQLAVSQLGPLVFLPLTQRQLLALSTWSASHRQALLQQGQALFPHRTVTLEQLQLLTPPAIFTIPRERRE